MKKRDRYLGQCDSIRTPQRRSKRNAKQNGDTTISGSALEPESCRRDVIGKTSIEELGGGGSFQHSSSNQIEEMDDESDWEDGTIPVLQSANNNRDDTFRGLTIEFSGSPDSAKKKPVRRASAEDKELAELVHKVHLLCLIARGRLIDSACDDPLIQASLLSLLPINLLKISEVSKLTANALVPLVRWFHSNFRTRSPKVEERSFRSALAFALETHEGTPEEIAALSVSLFRALKLTTRFVSILDVVSLKPGIDKSEPLSQDASRSGRGIFKSSTPMVCKLSRVSVSPVPSSSCCGTENNCQTSMGVAHGCKESCSGRNDTQSEGSPTADELSQRMLDSLACDSQNNPSEALDTKKSENLKRKGDLEYELQLEMALSATAAGVRENNTGSDVRVLHTDSSELSSPLKKIKFIKSEDSPTSSHGISTAIGSRKVGAPLYWAEVYCTGENLTGKWVHCDAVNAIIDGEQKVEAEAAACKTSLRYVVAFAGHGAKDVTRRYCMKWFRIAAQRINSVWWDAVLAPLKELESGATGGTVNLEKQQVNPSNANDKVDLSNDYGKKINSEFSMLSSSFAARSSLEDMELETRALTEPLPTNQQAYKSHHLYAIERWLTKYQILYPKGPVLGFCSGYPVYPRACVQTLKTKERWLREGLQVKANELPAKVLERSVKGSKLHTSEDNDCVEHEREPKFSVYGRWQLEPLRLPRAANGIVPKNERGQVDVWSEKCLPPGTVHLRLPRVFSIAKRLEVDSAPAMVGFEFRNGRSMPVFEGIVVCAEFKDAILAAYDEEEERRQAEEKKMNERQAISRWYQLLSSIVTRQRLNNCYGDGFSSQTTREIPIADTKFQEHVSGGRGNGQSLESQQEYVWETKIDASTTVQEENHVHIFLPEDQSYDEESFVRTKRCRCGFAIQVEEL